MTKRPKNHAQPPRPTTTTTATRHVYNVNTTEPSFARADPFITARTPCHEPICQFYHHFACRSCISQAVAFAVSFAASIGALDRPDLFLSSALHSQKFSPSSCAYMISLRLELATARFVLSTPFLACDLLEYTKGIAFFAHSS
jgi:hypothetical protein